MKLTVLAVGKPRGLLAAPIAEYEARVRRYFTLEVVEAKEFSSQQANSPAQVKLEEGKRLLARAPAGTDLIALHREGTFWSSEELSMRLGEAALRSRAGITFLIGGAFGLSDEVLRKATGILSLSGFTLPHEMARLVLAEQLYRACTILRGEPYHKGEPR